jgi:hypothetical protein
MEAGGLAQMPVVQEGPLRAAGAHDQADRDAGDHALSVGASREVRWAGKVMPINDLLRGGTLLHSSALQLLSVISLFARVDDSFIAFSTIFFALCELENLPWSIKN